MPESNDKNIAAGATRTLVLHPHIRLSHRVNARETAPSAVPSPGDTRRWAPDPDYKLSEAVGLAHAIDLTIVDAAVVPVAQVRPATLFGRGKVDELATQVKAGEIELVVVDSALSPVQQRNLEKALNAKVLDRTALILEIFSERARTKEGRLQVELAHLRYQKSRLVRSWTHLERQRGGLGFVGGPGETQIEADRRMIQERITRLERQLDTVKRTRGLHRKARQKVPYPVVALVGYTNAGKSTLFNRLTRADVMAEDMLFATLDPTLRAVDLDSGARVILSDTVGFISDLPPDLVAAFRATLEEVTSADILLHVRDIAHAQTEAQAEDVRDILDQLGIEDVEAGGTTRVVEVLNKIDLLDEDDRAWVESAAKRDPEGKAAVSALTGEGADDLLATIDRLLAAHREVVDVDVDPADGASQAWLYSNADVIDRSEAEDGRLRLRVGITDPALGRFRKRFVDSGSSRILGIAAD